MNYKLEAYKVVQVSRNGGANVLQSKIDLGNYDDIAEMEKAKRKHQKQTFKSYDYWVVGENE